MRVDVGQLAFTLAGRSLTPIAPLLEYATAALKSQYAGHVIVAPALTQLASETGRRGPSRPTHTSIFTSPSAGRWPAAATYT